MSNPSAWMAEDGRVIAASTKEAALRDGGAMKSSTEAYSIPLFTASPQIPDRTELWQMGDEPIHGWYFSCDDHYIDVEKDADGKYSIYFNDRKTGKDGWLDQAEQSASAISRRDFARLFGRHIKADVPQSDIFALYDALIEAAPKPPEAMK